MGNTVDEGTLEADRATQLISQFHVKGAKLRHYPEISFMVLVKSG